MARPSSRLVVAAWLSILPAAGEAGAGPFGVTGKSATDTAVVFDLGTGQAVGGDIDLLPEGNYPYDATMKPDGSEVWIPGAVGNGIIVIDVGSQAIVQRIDLTGQAEYPVDVLFEPCGDRAFAASRDSELVAILDAATYQVIDTVDMPGTIDAGKMAISPLRDTLYVVDWFDDFLVSVDLTTLTAAAVDVGTSLWDLALSPDESTLYLNDRGVDQVLVVDLDSLTVVDSVPVGDDPWGIDITPDGSKVVVASEDDSSVTIIDTATLTPLTVPLAADSDPRDVEIGSDGALAYVPSGDIAGNDVIYVLDTATGVLVDAIDVGPGETNVVAARPQPGCGLFADGFESGDTSAWDATVPD